MNNFSVVPTVPCLLDNITNEISYWTVVRDSVSKLLNTKFLDIITTFENDPRMSPKERMDMLGEICGITFDFRGDLSVVHIKESGTQSIQVLQEFVTWFMDYEKDRIDTINNNGPDQISGGYTSLRAKFAHAAGSHNLILDQTSGSISFPQWFLNLFLYPDYSNREWFDDLEPTVKAWFFSTANKIVDQYNRHDDEWKKMFLQESGLHYLSSPEDKMYVFFGPYSLVFTDALATIVDTHQESSSIGRRVIGTCPKFPHLPPPIAIALFLEK